MARKSQVRRPAPDQDRLIVEALRDAGGAVSAYELIDQLRDRATLAPQTVYRSLGRLIADGHAHRIESLNAFVACRHPAHEGVAVLAICEDCGGVTEFEEPRAVQRLGAWADTAGFSVRHTTIELRGRCRACGMTSAA